MKKITKKLILIATTLLVVPFWIVGQKTDCSMNYEKALIFYNSGMNDSAFITLQPCVDNKAALSGIPKENRARMYRLAALSCIMIGNGEKAEEYIRQLVACQPGYGNTPNPDDVMEFRVILERITPSPLLRIGAATGINIPFIKVEKKFSDYPTADGSYVVELRTGYQAAIIIEKSFTRNISFESGAGITSMNFTYTSNGLYDAGNVYINYSYDQNFILFELPLVCRYYFRTKSFRPYLEGGIEGRLFLNKMEKSDTYGKYWFTNSSNSGSILTTFPVDFEYVGILAGGGLSYAMKSFSIRLDIRYNQSIKNSHKISGFENINGFDDISTAEKFHYTDDINLIRQNNIQLSLGFLYNINYRVF
jgi:hypothetical protein